MVAYNLFIFVTAIVLPFSKRSPFLFELVKHIFFLFLIIKTLAFLLKTFLSKPEQNKLV